MIVFDFNQICVASVMVQASSKHGVIPGKEKLREMIFESLRQNINQFKQYANVVVIGIDGRKSWRKDVFKYYKAKRATDRQKIAPNVNWTEVFQTIDQIADDIEANFPYVVIRNEKAEGDDIVGTIVKYWYDIDPFDGIMIIGGDKDFKQLHFDSRVRQYSPVLKDYVKSEGAEIERKNIILSGDRLDGVPNVFSRDDCFVRDIRMTKLTAKRKAELLAYEHPDDIRDQAVRRNYYRNMVLTDLAMTPKAIQQDIIEQFETKRQNLPMSMKVFNYLVNTGLVELSRKAGDYVI